MSDHVVAGALDAFHGAPAIEEYFREVFLHSFQAVWVLTPDGTVRDANHVALAVMGVSVLGAPGLKIWEAPAWRESVQLGTDIRAAVAAVAAGASVRFETDLVNPDAPVALDMSFKALPDRNGGIALIVAEGRDVGVRARAERALRESEERFNRILSIAADAIISMDEAHRVTMFNHGAEQIFGYAASEMIGQPLDVLLPIGVGMRHSDAVREFATGPVEARRMGERREIFGRRKSGEVFRAEASISKVTVGGRAVFTAVVRDVNERWMREQERAQLLDAAMRARADAERERERISVLAHVSDVLSASLDYTESLRTMARLLVPRIATLCIVDIVEAEGPGIRRVDVVGGRPGSRDAAAFLRGLSLSRDGPYLTRRTMESGVAELVPSVTDDHIRSIAPDDRHFDAFRSLGLASLLCVPLAARGTILGVMALGRDESVPPFSDADQVYCEEIARRAALAIDNARLYQRVQEAARQRDVVLGVVSHDLRNPLSAIGMCVSGLEHAPADDAPKRAELLSTIRSSVAWAQGLIADLLDIASLEAGKLSFEARPTDPVILVARAAHLFDPSARDKSIRLTATTPDDMPAVLADERRTIQVLSNLVSNALKYAPPGGSVTLSALPTDTEVVFAVEDNGPGIPPDDVPRLFDRFWHARRGAEYAGTGLGLAIAKGIVDAHGGRIWVETQPGAGTTFKFSLPRSPAPAR